MEAPFLLAIRVPCEDPETDGADNVDGDREQVRTVGGVTEVLYDDCGRADGEPKIVYDPLRDTHSAGRLKMPD